jgi:hypothetical protein
MIAVFHLTGPSHHILMHTWCFGEAYSYPEVWRVTFGTQFTWIPILAVNFAYFFCIVNGFREVQLFVPNAIVSVWPNSPAIVSDPWFVQYLCLVFCVLPCCFAKRISWFGWSAWVSLIATIIAVLCLALHTFQNAAATGITPEAPLAT